MSIGGEPQRMAEMSDLTLQEYPDMSENDLEIAKGRISDGVRPSIISVFSWEKTDEIGPFSRALPCWRRKFLSFSSRGIFLRQIRVRCGPMTAEAKVPASRSSLPVPTRRPMSVHFPYGHKIANGLSLQDAAGPSETVVYVSPSARSARKVLPANRLLRESWIRPLLPAEESPHQLSMCNPPS